MKIRSVRAELFHVDRQTDRHDKMHLKTIVMSYSGTFIVATSFDTDGSSSGCHLV